MKKESVYCGVKKSHIISLIGLWLVLNSSLAHADAGVPMIFITLPSMVLALIPIILIEALIFKHLLRINYKQAIQPSLSANFASTIIGFPLSWLLMVIIEITIGSKAYGITSLLGKITAVTGQAAWLIPYRDALWWMIPVAAAVGLIPAFFVSVIMEYWVVIRYFQEKTRAQIRAAVIKANLVTYALLVMFWLANLAFQTSVHYRWITLTPEDKIIVEATKAIKANPGDYKAYCRRGLALTELEGREKGLPDIDKAIEIKPDDPDLYVARGNLYRDNFISKEKIDKAIADYNKALEIDSTFKSVLKNRNKAFEKLRKIEETSTDISKAHIVIECAFVGTEKIEQGKTVYDAVDDTPDLYGFQKDMKDYKYIVKFKVIKRVKGVYDSDTFTVAVNDPNNTFDLRGEYRIPYRIFLDAGGKRMIQRQFVLD